MMVVLAHFGPLSNMLYCTLVEASFGVGVGAMVGAMVGGRVGALVGACVGVCVGACVGALVGALVGGSVGALVGALVMSAFEPAALFWYIAGVYLVLAVFTLLRIGIKRAERRADRALEMAADV